MITVASIRISSGSATVTGFCSILETLRGSFDRWVLVKLLASQRYASNLAINRFLLVRLLINSTKSMESGMWKSQQPQSLAPRSQRVIALSLLCVALARVVAGCCWQQLASTTTLATVRSSALWRRQTNSCCDVVGTVDVVAYDLHYKCTSNNLIHRSNAEEELARVSLTRPEATALKSKRVNNYRFRGGKNPSRIN